MDQQYRASQTVYFNAAAPFSIATVEVVSGIVAMIIMADGLIVYLKKRKR